MSAPACWNSANPFAKGGTTSGSAVSAHGHLCGECDTVSSAAPTGTNRCTHCSQVAACPWPEPPAGPRRGTDKEALHRRIGDAQTPSRGHAGPAGTALLAVRGLNGVGAPALLPAMHRIVNAVRPGLIGPEAALYGYWME